MSAAQPQFSIDDAFELTLEDTGPGPESSGVARFGPLHFERRARFEVADEDKQSRLRYQNLENDEDGAQASPELEGGVSTRDSGRTSIRSSQWSFSTVSSNTQRTYNACCSWTQHPLIQKNCKTFSRACQVPCFENTELGELLGEGPYPGSIQLSADPGRRGTGGGSLSRCL
ncbi:transmembrane protein 134 isoform X3 [Castor canadensis]|uniref:Transmembrane protein 134 isoform X3 n=1 Tax=Castor canadensis TaxID=51338 RepID=A0AC58KNN3_CASCN